jgi:predicted outer membrane repeat protein
MYAHSVTLSMTGVSFLSNTATYSGAGLFATGSTITSSGTTYSGNVSSSGGGGAAVQGSGSYTGTTDDFDSNHDGVAGAGDKFVTVNGGALTLDYGGLVLGLTDHSQTITLLGIQELNKADFLEAVFPQ